MNNTAWCVLGILIGVVCTIAFYEAEYRSVCRQRDKFERHLHSLAHEYGQQTMELERLRARQ